MIIYPLIINNTFISSYLQKINVFNLKPVSNIWDSWPNVFNRIKEKIKEEKFLKIGNITKLHEVLCPISWGSLNYCVNVHNQFVKDVRENNLDKYRIDNIVLENSEPVSINCCCWLGEDLKKVVKKYGDVIDDEPWFCLFTPTKLERKNVIYGKTLVSHYAFYKQRNAGLDKTDISEKYYKLF